MALKSHYWWDLTTRDFAECDMGGIVAILPIAAVEQHGPHLPVRVDAAINAGIVASTVALMDDDFPVLVLPAMPIGKSNEHDAFKGTLGLSYETLARVWFEIGACVHRTGCRKIILFNSHGGQPQVMEIVTRELRVKLDMFAVSCSWFKMTDTSDLFDAKERQFGIHGGQSETSVMLHLHPDLVAMEYAENFVPKSVALAATNAILTPEGAVGFGGQTQDLQAAGACGDARSAKAELGAEVVSRAARRFYALIEEVIKYPLADITQMTRYGRI